MSSITASIRPINFFGKPVYWREKRFSDEDLDCSGLSDTSDVICIYDEGFIQGILESFSGKGFNVRGIDCWCIGSRTCRFEAKTKVS